MVIASFLASGAVAQSAYPVAGVTPDRRPEGAPVIKEFKQTDGWRKQYLRGVSQPTPPGLGLADQGAWYTPFNRPGMPSPYDIRGWHKPAARAR